MAISTTTNIRIAQIFGAIFLLIGLWGYFQDPILGVFGVNGLHNIVHLLSGIVLLAAAYAADGRYAPMTNAVFGVVYAIVALLGFAGILVVDLLGMESGSLLADNLLHTLLAVTFAVVGFGAGTSAARGHHAT